MQDIFKMTLFEYEEDLSTNKKVSHLFTIIVLTVVIYSLSENEQINNTEVQTVKI